jgi:5-methylthioadenosine/S-adenosylhomocysteine deaminase
VLFRSLDLFGEMRLAALLAKGVAEDPAVLPAARALEMATLSGARALGLEREIGSLEAGKAADLVAVDLSVPGSLPCFDPLSDLVYSAGRDQVSHVWVAGKARVAEGRCLSLDPVEIRRMAGRWRGLIRR